MIVRILLTILIICAISVGVFAATFGRTDIGPANVNGLIDNEVNCREATPSTSGTATDIFWYTTNTSATKLSKGAIYVSTSDTDAGALLATSGEITTAVDAAWRNATISLALTASTDYFLCAWGADQAGTNLLHYSNTGGLHLEDTAGYTGTFPDPLVESATGTRDYSIYVVYTETGTGRRVVLGGGLF